MDWRVKAAVQRTLGYVPGGDTIHRRLQQTVGELRNTNQYIASKIDDWEVMVTILGRHGMKLPGRRLLEIGTGWLPVLPHASLMAGVETVFSVDLNRHLSQAEAARCAAVMAGYVPRIVEVTGEPVGDVRARHAAIVAAPMRAGLDYLAPADARNTDLPEECVDLVFSNSVFEHVGPEDVAPLFDEAMRVLRPGGIAFHSINCGDHYAYFDRSISQLNYLRYSDKEWSWWNTRYLYQNRMRACEFVAAAVAAGFIVEEAATNPGARRMEALAKVPVHSRFARFTPEELCITSVDLVARKP